MKRTPEDQRLTKIVCTIGPIPESGLSGMLEGFYEQGMDVARLNMSHCDDDWASEREILDWVNGHGLPDQGPRLATIGDLQGPKVRLAQVAREDEVLPEGEEIVLREGEQSDDASVLPISPPLAAVVFRSIGQAIDESGAPVTLTLGDGDCVLIVTEANQEEAVARVRVGGPVRSRMGFTPRGVDLELDPFTEKDRADLAVLIEHNATFVGASFVRTAEDLRRIRHYIEDTLGAPRPVPIIAKIETAAAVKNIHSILQAADGIMVARGDLGLHVDIEEVPQIQKRLIQLCRTAAKPVIIATQMLESMTERVEPTRAEVTDVFNAIMDGCDAVMLSGETSRGDHPLEAINVMDRIAHRAELWRSSQQSSSDSDRLLFDLYESYGQDESEHLRQVDDEIARAVCQLAEGIGGQLIATLTTTGATPRRVARHRTRMPVVAGGEDVKVLQELLLTYGIHPLRLDEDHSHDFQERIDNFTERLAATGWAESGDTLVLTGGQPPWPRAGTNLLKVHIVP